MTCERDALQDEMRVLAESSRYTRERITRQGECWVWTGSLHTRRGVDNPQGCDGGKNYSPRRFLYEKWRGVTLARRDYTLPACGNDRCVRPCHVQIMTPQALHMQGRPNSPRSLEDRTKCKKCGRDKIVVEWARGVRRYCKFCHNNYRLMRDGVSVDAIAAIRNAQHKERDARRSAKQARHEQRERERAEKLARVLAMNSPTDSIPEFSAEYIAEAKARAKAEFLERMQEKPPLPPPPVDRKEAIRRRLLAEIEEMAKTRSDE